MSVTTMSRVDATHPVLAQLVDAASKGFTGALEVSTTDAVNRELQVQVWLEDGQVRAVHANGWTPPAAAFVLARTGVDFSGEEDPLRAAYATERDGQPLLDADTIDGARRDWAYGLLAAALTWAKPRVHRVKKAVATENKILPSPWQRITADVAARVDGLESAWRVVCDALTQAGIPPVSAGRACGILAVRIEGHALFTGAESLDQTAGRAGISRYAILEELSRAVLSGAPVQFGQAGPAETRLLVPEHWEDPTRSWGWVDEHRPEPVAAQVDADPEPVAELEATPVPLDELPDDDGLDELEEMVAPPPLLDPEPAPEPVHVVGPSAPSVCSARQLIEVWLQGSADESDASVRVAIVHRLITSAHQEAQERAEHFQAAQEALQSAEMDAEASQLVIARAQEALTEAQGALEQAEVQVARVEAEYADIVQAARDAAEHAQAAQAKADAEEVELTRLMEQLAVQEQAAVSARAEATQSAQVASVAAREVQETAGPVLAQARELAEQVRQNALVPAAEGLRSAQERASAAQDVAARARATVDEAWRAAEHARVVASTLGAEQAA